MADTPDALRARLRAALGSAAPQLQELLKHWSLRISEHECDTEDERAFEVQRCRDELVASLSGGSAAESEKEPPRATTDRRALASEIVLHVRRGAWHTSEVEQFLRDNTAAFVSQPSPSAGSAPAKDERQRAAEADAYNNYAPSAAKDERLRELAKEGARSFHRQGIINATHGAHKGSFNFCPNEDCVLVCSAPRQVGLNEGDIAGETPMQRIAWLAIVGDNTPSSMSKALRQIYELAARSVDAAPPLSSAGGPATCPHCELPPILPEVCTPEIHAVIEKNIARDWALFGDGYDLGKRASGPSTTLAGSRNNESVQIEAAPDRGRAVLP